MKKTTAMLLIATFSLSILAGCGKSEQPSADQQTTIVPTTDNQTTAQTIEITSPEDDLASYTVKDLDLNDVALMDYVKENKKKCPGRLGDPFKRIFQRLSYCFNL